MLNCLQTLKQLHRYLDRDLTDDEIADVKRHLAACPPCHHHVRFEEGVRRLVRTRCSGDSAPAHLRDRLLEKLRGIGS